MTTHEPTYSARFDIERTHTALYDVGSALNSSSAQLLGIILVATVLIFGDAGGNQIELPLVSLKISQAPAANIAVVLAAVWGYRLKALELTQRMLRRKLGKLTRDNGVESAGWNLEYPGFLAYRHHLKLLNSRSANRLGYLLRAGYYCIWSLGPLVLAAASLFQLGFSIIWALSAAVSVSLIALSALSESLHPRRNQGKALLQRLESDWWPDMLDGFDLLPQEEDA